MPWSCSGPTTVNVLLIADGDTRHVRAGEGRPGNTHSLLPEASLICVRADLVLAVPALIAIWAVNEIASNSCFLLYSFVWLARSRINAAKSSGSRSELALVDTSVTIPIMSSVTTASSSLMIRVATK